MFIRLERGNKLDNEPEFQRRIAEGTFKPLKTQENKDETASGKARKGLVIFIIGILLVVLMGSLPELRPLWNDGHTIKRMDVPTTLQIIMLTTACIIMLICRIPPLSLDFGLRIQIRARWCGGYIWPVRMMNSFFAAWSDLFNSAYRDFQNPLLFRLLVFILSAVIYSPAATAVALFPAGVMMGYPAATLIALLPLTCEFHFIIPGGAPIGCVAFNRTGTTKIGKYVVNHSYILPGLVTTLSSSVFCFLLAGILL